MSNLASRMFAGRDGSIRIVECAVVLAEGREGGTVRAFHHAFHTDGHTTAQTIGSQLSAPTAPKTSIRPALLFPLSRNVAQQLSTCRHLVEGRAGPTVWRRGVLLVHGHARRLAAAVPSHRLYLRQPVPHWSSPQQGKGFSRSLLPALGGVGGRPGAFACQRWLWSPITKACWTSFE